MNAEPITWLTVSAQGDMAIVPDQPGPETFAVRLSGATGMLDVAGRLRMAAAKLELALTLEARRVMGLTHDERH